jgi:histone acetyltransferase 1
MPPGTRVHTYSQHGRTFHIHQADFSSPSLVQLYDRIKIFALLYIDGAVTLTTDDTKWIFFIQYEQLGEKYRMVGYVALYKFFYYPDKWRMRISQFLILPHYQRQGHGMTLYNFCMDYYATQSDVAEVNVEDPNEAFSDMRDRCDLIRMAQLKALNDTLPTPSTVTDITKTLKLNKRQSERCIEMLLLRKLTKKTKPSQNKMKPYRLFVKKRLYKHNIDTLAQVDTQERNSKLEETYQSCLQDYERLLKLLNKELH